MIEKEAERLVAKSGRQTTYQNIDRGMSLYRDDIIETLCKKKNISLNQNKKLPHGDKYSVEKTAEDFVKWLKQNND